MIVMISEGDILEHENRAFRIDHIFYDDEERPVSFVAELLEPEGSEQVWYSFRVLDVHMIKIATIH
jgi:hypothetical protein